MNPTPWVHRPRSSAVIPAPPRPSAGVAARLGGAVLSATMVGLLSVGIVPVAQPPRAEGSAVIDDGLPASERAVVRQRSMARAVNRVAEANQERLARERREVLTAEAEEIRTQAALLATRFSWPTAGGVGVGFGTRRHPITKKVALHNGVDIGGFCGQPVVAPAAGRVMFVGFADDAGHYLRIDHGTVNGKAVYTTYLHLAAFLVRVGQPVARGQAVAKVGSSGLATGCHLHFSVVENGQVVDPMAYLRG